MRMAELWGGWLDESISLRSVIMMAASMCRMNAIGISETKLGARMLQAILDKKMAKECDARVYARLICMGEELEKYL